MAINDGHGATKHSINNAATRVTKEDVQTMLSTAMLELVDCTENSINPAIDKRLKGIKTGSEQGGGGKTTADMDVEKKIENYKATIEQLQKAMKKKNEELAEAKKNVGSENNDSTKNNGNGNPTHKKCTHCGGFHYGGARFCWKKPENRHLATDKWRAANPAK